jgi:predicted dehydrogenase
LPWRVVAEHSGGGLVLDLGCHTLDVLDFVLGPLRDVSGSAANCASPYDVEDTVGMSFVAEGGAPGTAHWSFATEALEDRLDVLGTEGRVTLSTFGTEPVEVMVRGEIERIEAPNPPHIQQPMIQSVVDALEDGAACPSTGVSAARTSAVLDRVLASYYGTRDADFWRDTQRWPGRRFDLNRKDGRAEG